MKEVLWNPNPVQGWAINCPYPEIGMGGARGGGKTEAGMAWLLKDAEHSQFRGLVLRKNYTDLKDWIDRAQKFYASYGCKLVGGDFRWPKGGVIRTGHFADDKSFQKYVGHEYHRILIEELNLIPREENYLKLFGSCRSTIPELRAQVFSTFNPSDEGFYWIKKRFNLHGIPREKVTTKDAITGAMRVFIPAKIDDNPYLSSNATYKNFLDQLPEGLREAWRDGSWEDPEISGGIYTSEMNQAMNEKRIKLVPIDRLLKVHTVWDLGISDSMAIVFVQRVKDATRIIHYYENQGFGLPHYSAYLQNFQMQKQISYGKHFAPFDINKRELSTGKTIKDLAKNLNLLFEDVPMVTKHAGIERVRLMFPRLYFNESETEQLRIALQNYKKEWDEKRLMFKDEPVHDWSSHGADTVRYLALVEDKMTNEQHKNKYVQPPYEPISPNEYVAPQRIPGMAWGEQKQRHFDWEGEGEDSGRII